MRKRRRRTAGLLPSLGQWLWAFGRHLAQRPQLLLLCAVLSMALWALVGYVQRSDAFRVTQVSFPPGPPFTLREPIIGANLLGLDLHALADQLKQQQSWLREVRVVRQLPSAIRIEAIPRALVAQVRLDRWPPHLVAPPDGGAHSPEPVTARPASGRPNQVGGWYPVDQSGFILPQGSAEPAPHRVRLTGFERAGTALRVGKDNTDERLRLALRVLQKWRRGPPPLAQQLVEINVADPQQIRFIIDASILHPTVPGSGQDDGGIEVRCGSEAELDMHLKRLQAALKAVARSPVAVKYLDVRFKEPVIGPRP
ncbi:MAG: FtsQ-type POTRA domain-containing protein [Candidatus Omnitrophica bacterium]|nr:FtsQ-type POTRA domain-containing protein [Candidatus Omnitrophota bacterium]MBI2496154.1 FtsQ-type POTRA domain-containing protein [Candidatus Omnitrophota bacterium]MBI3020432.1 FtsQ-type POTRA domain-containing protein [Candidatus Omnitrophota bacterium]